MRNPVLFGALLVLLASAAHASSPATDLSDCLTSGLRVADCASGQPGIPQAASPWRVARAWLRGRPPVREAALANLRGHKLHSAHCPTTHLNLTLAASGTALQWDMKDMGVRYAFFDNSIRRPFGGDDPQLGLVLSVQW